MVVIADAVIYAVVLFVWAGYYCVSGLDAVYLVFNSKGNVPRNIYVYFAGAVMVAVCEKFCSGHLAAIEPCCKTYFLLILDLKKSKNTKVP